MSGPDTDALGSHTMVVECVAHLAVAAAFLQQAPYGPMHMTSPAELAIDVVNDSCKKGRLGMLHTALTKHLR